MLFEGGARRSGISGQRLTPTEAEMEQMPASYQGDDGLSIVYGRELIGVYRVFKRFDAIVRNRQYARPVPRRRSSSPWVGAGAIGIAACSRCDFPRIRYRGQDAGCRQPILIYRFEC
ncbi:MAG TPA: hypothetical protein VN408_38900 [Actinoplanes sp.]|nr:hypothetical protein [Actinoplanes sp.]